MNKTLKKIRNNNVGNFFRRFLGIRMLKTALAVSLSIVVAQYLDLKIPLMTGLAAVVTMSNSVFDSVRSSINRLISTVIGVFIATIFRQIGIVGFIPMFIGILIIINICNYMKWNSATSLAIMVFIIVMLYSPSPPEYLSVWQYGLNRIVDTSVGLIVGVLVNILIAPPNQTEFIIKTYQKTLVDMEEAFLQSLNGEQVNMNRIIKDIALLSQELEDVKQDGPFSNKEGIKYSKLSKTNANFYSLSGFISQFSDADTIPCLNEENKKLLNEYFGEDLIFDGAEKCSIDVENVYNQQVNHCIGLLVDLRDIVKNFTKKLD